MVYIYNKYIYHNIYNKSYIYIYIYYGIAYCSSIYNLHLIHLFDIIIDVLYRFVVFATQSIQHLYIPLTKAVLCVSIDPG